MPGHLWSPSVSLACTILVLGSLVVRGAEDWSGMFGTLWYGLLAGSVLFGLVGIGGALAGRELRPAQRALAIALSAPPLLVAAFLAFAIMSTVSHMN